MPSKAPFSFVNSQSVAPIVCISCGNNAHCIRREPRGLAELQCFRCAVCGRESMAMRGEAPSDYQIEKDAEQIAGVRNATEEKLDRSRRRRTYRRWFQDKLAKAGGAAEANQRGDPGTGVSTAHPGAKD